MRRARTYMGVPSGCTHLLWRGKGLLAAPLATGGPPLLRFPVPQRVEAAAGWEAAVQAPAGAAGAATSSGRPSRSWGTLQVDGSSRGEVLWPEAGLAEDVSGVAEAAAGATHNQVLGIVQLPARAGAGAGGSRRRVAALAQACL